MEQNKDYYNNNNNCNIFSVLTWNCRHCGLPVPYQMSACNHCGWKPSPAPGSEQYYQEECIILTAETHFDEQDTSKVEQLEKDEQHLHYAQHWVEFKGNELFLIGKCKASNEVLLKYAKWIEDASQLTDNLKSEQLEDYVCSRLENVHNILMPFFIEGFISNKTYGNYIEYNNRLLENLEKELKNGNDNIVVINISNKTERIGLLNKCNEMINYCIDEVLASLNKK